jgi:hypothetical protein
MIRVRPTAHLQPLQPLNNPFDGCRRFRSQSQRQLHFAVTLFASRRQIRLFPTQFLESRLNHPLRMLHFRFGAILVENWLSRWR